MTDEKILDTLQLAEQSGIYTAILRTDEHILRVLKRYRTERGGKMQWIAQRYPRTDDPRTNVRLAIDNGVVAAFPMGAVAERFLREGKMELIARGARVHAAERARGGARSARAGTRESDRRAGSRQ